MFQVKRDIHVVILLSIVFLFIIIAPPQVENSIPISMAAPIPLWDYHNGNWTYVDKLGFPVNITYNHIPIGKNWTYVYTLDNDSQYHVYFYGKWIGTKTDYDIFVYDPNGELETYHTESYGLPEHLGTTVEHPLFTPKKNGNYSILLVNDGEESKDAKNGTLLVIEHLDVNRWYVNKLYMEGKDPLTNKPRYNSTYVYEFNSSKRHIEITVDVPQTLDMYEVRLYPMATPNLGSVLSGIPIAWELGLYNRTSSVSPYTVGGYNINFSGYRGPIDDASMLHKGASFDSCEQPGEDMFINYTSPYSGNVLYHLVFLAEWNYRANSPTGGFLSFIIKTDFTKPFLNVSKPSVVYAGKATVITAISNDTESGIESVKMFYSINNGLSWNSTTMTQNQPQVYTTGIPGQPAGTTVLYKVEAQDYAGNKAVKEGSYQPKSPSAITCGVSSLTPIIGKGVPVSGAINASVSVEVIIKVSTDNGATWSNLTKVTTASNGTYSYTWTPTSIKSYLLKASWLGDGTYYEATSGAVSATVTKAKSSITCSISEPSITYGSSVTISGNLTDASTGGGLSKRTVYLKNSTDGGSTWSNITSVLTGTGGVYSYVWPPNAGPFVIKAEWAGNYTYEGATSSSVELSVVMITCSLSNTKINSGDEFTVSGSINPTVSGKNVILTYKKPDGSTLNRTVTTGSDGSYSDKYTPDAIGSWSVSANWGGDKNYKGATSSEKSFTVSKISTTISCSISKSAVTEGEFVAISGSISPKVSGKLVTLTYRKPDGKNVTKTVTTGSDGNYSDSYTPDSVGSWSITTSWDGDSTHEGASSSKSFTVSKKSGCFIATATYGSELSPEVQFLRDFRDNIVLKTFVGSQFMSVFNGIYYSFSPTVASGISSNEVFRGLMKIVLYPLMGILHLGAEAYSILNFSPELGILVFCLVVSSLMSIVYLVPWALFFSLLKKTVVSKKTIHIVGLIWIGSILITVASEVLSSPLLLMASGSVFVLTTSCLTTLTMVRAITKRYIQVLNV